MCSANWGFLNVTERYSAEGAAERPDIKWWVPAEAYDHLEQKAQEMMSAALKQNERIHELEAQLKRQRKPRA